jgi:anti-sigma factor RsiW
MSTCQDLQALISSFVDGQLSADERATVVAHLDDCADCRGVVADLEHLRAAARLLGPLPAPDHVWLEVAGQIRLGQAFAPAARRVPRRPALAQWLALAAALVVVTLGVYLVDVLRAPTPVSGGTPPASLQTVAQELTLALEHYDKAIAELQVIAKNKENEGTLDPAVTASLQKNLNVIDQAIADSRAALATDPESEPARESLIDSLRRKIGVLQTTVALMNEMRKGDAAGAARVAAGAGRS